MSVGQSPQQQEEMYLSIRSMCEQRLGPSSIFRLLEREGGRLFPDSAFADLFSDVGRQSIPPHIVAVVMVLQRMHGMSDREAVEAFSFDARWKFAAGAFAFDHPSFVHTVLVDMRARLRSSKRPDRIFDAVLQLAKDAGLVGRKRVLDSTCLYDAVATQDTVTMIRSALRQVLKAADKDIGKLLRSQLKRNDSYLSAGKPICDWDDKAAQETLVDELAQDANAVLEALQERKMSIELAQASELLAAVVGQDLEKKDGRFKIARKTAPNRIISTVDPETRHGHKTSARGFDGYKGHVIVDPDSEMILATEVTPGNAGDGNVAIQLLDASLEHVSAERKDESLEVYGDAAYGKSENVRHVEEQGGESFLKLQGPPARDGMFSKDDFIINMKAGTVTCPQGALVQIRVGEYRAGRAHFQAHCADCPQKSRCTTAATGRTVEIHRDEELVQAERKKQKDSTWKQRYKSTRPKVERKIAHMMRRKHGGRRARVRGRERVAQDFSLLGAATNLLRLSVVLGRTPG